MSRSVQQSPSFVLQQPRDGAAAYLLFVCAQNLARSESLMFYNSDAGSSVMPSQKPLEEKAVTPSPEQVFAECSQKRILGLLAAMLPPVKLVRDKWSSFLEEGW